MDRYMCYHCKGKTYKTSTLIDLINHCIYSHGSIELKYRELILDERDGGQKYMSKVHEGIVPDNVEKTGKRIEVRDGLVYLVDERSKKKRLNTPIKVFDTRRALAFGNQESRYGEEDKIDETTTQFEHMNVENDSAIDNDETLQHLTDLLPNVLSTLEEAGQANTFKKFNELLASGEFPMKNICYLLFLDVVDWFSNDNTSKMRYREETVKFWQIGFRLFHGKYLRFMSGLRNTGQILERDSQRGVHDPSTSKINFAVPSRNNLYPKKDDSHNFYPGIFKGSMESLVVQLGGKPLKLAVDGKKICRGKGKTLGDIDCWGFESKPTLQERRNSHATEVNFVKVLNDKIDKIERHGCTNVADIPQQSSSEIVNDLKEVVKNIAEKNNLLRVNVKSLEQTEEKFKKLGGENWKTSRFYPVICSVRVNQCEANKQIEDGLSITDKLAHCGAALNGEESVYCVSDRVILGEQRNLFQLDEHHQTDDPRHIPQRTEAWHSVRDTAKVTGSTCHKALGLGLLKEQQQHYNQVFKNAEKPVFDAEAKKRMEYGVVHEIDAVATLAGKVLPFLLPGQKYFEEGCAQVRYGEDPSFMVVSPDGSIRSRASESPCMMYENKCKAPNAYSSSAYYKIPHYYVTQLLCEMHAYDCKEVLFSCWSEQSMTVFIAYFDEELWSSCWAELIEVYGEPGKPRPKRFSQASKDLKEKVKRFTESNVHLVGEFPSCKAVASQRNKRQSSTGPYIEHEKAHGPSEDISIRKLRECLVTTKQWLENTYHHLRSVATEILVYMVNDLDRMYHMEISNAHPIAYALKGPSLTTDAFRKMTDHVIEECEESGLKIVATASDGQWHQYGIRDNQGTALTLHQLHKDHWATVKSKNRLILLSDIKKVYIVNDISDVNYEKTERGIMVYGHKREKNLIEMKSLRSRSARLGEPKNKSKDTCSEEIDENESVGSKEDTGQIPAVCINEEFEDMLDESTIGEIDRITSQSVVIMPQEMTGIQPNVIADIEPCLFHSIENLEGREMFDGQYNQNGMEEMSTHDSCSDNDTLSVGEDIHQTTMTAIRNAHDILYGEDFDPLEDLPLVAEIQHMDCARQEDNRALDFQPEEVGFFDRCDSQNQQIQAPSENYQDDKMTQPRHAGANEMRRVLDHASYGVMLEALINDKKSMEQKNWRDFDEDHFAALFETKSVMNRKFYKHELSVCLKSIRLHLADLGIECNPKWAKYVMVDFFLTQRDNVVDMKYVTPILIPVHCPVQLKIKSAAVVAKSIPKETLAIVIAEQTWGQQLMAWNSNSPVANGMEIGDLGTVEQWFTKPNVGTDGNVRFHYTDACHILTCLRTKICTTGISGLQRKAWEVAALSKETNLNISVVVDCVDKQDVSMARRMFSEDVEMVMSNGFCKEAEFCKLVRNWFNAEDEPSIDVMERCRRRMEIRDWLLQGYRIGEFPPPTRYVKGIPIVTYEGLLAHLERKLQMYAFLPAQAYNVRATGSQEVENFFSTFRDMDPTGKGTPKPDVIPEMMNAVAEVDNFRLDPEKPFFVKTSSAPVYQTQPFLQRTHGDNEDGMHLIRTPEQSSILSRVVPRNHWFDTPERDTKRHKRRMTRISQPDEPAHGERGVRQFHARDDSKILAHHRKGYMYLPDK